MSDRRSYKVNINRASADELFRGIPGIRRDKIDHIIQNRPFRSWEDMQFIPGLSPEMIEHIKDNAIIE
jgi:competence ComEA-like helix-hairpin-helix protein